MIFYKKYLKYKNKYLKIKKQLGGVECIDNRVFTNYLDTCWAISVQTMITFGDVTSNNLEEIMNSFKIDDNFSHNIESKRCFIQRQIIKVQNDCELKQAFPPYIFNDDKIINLKNILESLLIDIIVKFLILKINS
jgi:hypothetical protein